MFHTRPDKRENYENVEDKYTFLIWEIQQFFLGGNEYYGKDCSK